jgi:putative flippase GtrA
MSNTAAWVRDKGTEVIRFLKFVAVGGIGTVIDFGLFNLLHTALGVNATVSNMVSFSAAIVNNYLWSRYWVFSETKDEQGGKKFAQFVLVNVIAWVLNTAVVWSVDRWVLGMTGLVARQVGAVAALLRVEHGFLAANAAKVIGTWVILLWNFFANRYWTFRDIDEADPGVEASTESA